MSAADGGAAAPPDTTLDRLLRILGPFDADHRELTVAALVRRAALPLPTAYRWVDRLSQAELLERDADGRIRPGLRLWEIASRAAPATSLSLVLLAFAPPGDAARFVERRSRVQEDGEPRLRASA
ncbi:helix-turn-helix domain-containing protein [Micrococcus porci]|uniref:helix-turn-helix domain-containing protein n=1 Tax=Micrococcus porci TaxID=2856555 RepID=UPI003CE6D09F